MEVEGEEEDVKKKMKQKKKHKRRRRGRRGGGERICQYDSHPMDTVCRSDGRVSRTKGGTVERQLTEWQCPGMSESWSLEQRHSNQHDILPKWD